MPKRIFFSLLFLFALFFHYSYSISNTPVNQPGETSLTESLSVNLAPVKVVAGDLVESPEKLTIDSISLTAGIIPTGLNDQFLQTVPKENNLTGWWQYGAKLGMDGKKIIVGHFKLEDGQPGVFFNLHKITPEDAITLEGISLKENYKVISVKFISLKDFPTGHIYSNSNQNELILITCAGTYSDGDYDKRLIITAEKI